MNGLLRDLLHIHTILGVYGGFWTPLEHQASSVPDCDSHSWTQSGAPSTMVTLGNLMSFFLENP